MSKCNFCILKDIKKDAKKISYKVTKKTAKFSLGGTDIFVHPKTIKIDDSKEIRDKYFVAWLMEIGDYCEC